MVMGVITTDKIAAPAGPFSPAVISDGSLYLSGQVAQDPVSGKLIGGDTAQQTDQILRNAGAVLQAAGKGFADVAVVALPLGARVEIDFVAR